MSNYPSAGRWRVIARTVAGHTIVLDDHMTEMDGQELYSECVDALMHINHPRHNVDDASHVLEGRIGAVRLDAVEAVQLGYDRTVR